MEKFKKFLKENKTIILLITGIVIVSILIIFGIYRIFFYSNVPDEIIKDTKIDSIDQLSDTQKEVINIDNKKSNIEKLEEKSYSKEYKEYEKKSEKEKKKIEVVPKKEEVPKNKIDEIIDDNDYDDKKVPKKFNLKDKIKLRVEDQESYGLCWDFASMKSLETNMQLHGLGEQDFSESHVDYITSNLMYGYRPIHDGGNFEVFTEYSDLSGFVKEEDVKYGEHTEDEYSKYTDLETVAHITKTVEFPTVRKENNKAEEMSDKELEEFRNTVKQHIMENGSLYAVIATEGIDDKTVYCSDDCFPDHAISVVGWDDNYSKDNFKSPTGKKPEHDGAYIILNSWGTDSGDKGYYYVSYDDSYIEFSMEGVASTSKEDYIKISEIDNSLTVGLIYSNLNYAITNIDGEDYISQSALDRVSSLDLSNRGLTNEDLEALSIFKNLYSLDLSKNDITNVSELINHKYLGTVDLSDNRISDVSILNSLENLSYIDLKNNLQVSGYSELERLYYLDISDCNLSDLEDISKLKNLEVLNLSENTELNYKSLKFKDGLRRLKLSNTSLKDLKDLDISADSKISSLDLSNNDIKNYSELEKLENLAYLEVKNNNISDISEFNNIKLYSLDLSNNKIKDLSEFNNKDINTLILNNNTELKNMESIKNVQTIYLEDCGLSNFDELSKLTNTEYLMLNGNNLSDLNGVASLKDLVVLSLNDNKLTNLNGVEDLKNLYAISADNNDLTDISAIKDLSNITTLSVEGNSKIEKYDLPDSMMYLNLKNCGLNEKTDLDGLKKLAYINTTDNPEFKNIGQLIRNSNSEWLEIENNNTYTIGEVKELANLADEQGVDFYLSGVKVDYDVAFDKTTGTFDVSNDYFIRQILMKEIMYNTIKSAYIDKKVKTIYVYDLYNPIIKIDSYYLDKFYVTLTLTGERVEEALVESIPEEELETTVEETEEVQQEEQAVTE